MALAPELASRVITNLLDEVDALRAQLTAGGASVGATDSAPAAPRAAPQGPLRRDCALRDALLANHDTFVFDMDGVVYSGAAMIPRANAAIGALMRAGKAVVFVTNNSGKSRREVLAKMEGLGFTGLAIEQILNSGYALALHLRRLSAPGSGSAFRGRKVYSLGGDGVTEELRLAGIDVLHGGSAYSQQCLARLDLTECAAIVPDAAVGAVVTGFNPLCSYHMLTYASMALTSDPSVLFLATNHDKLSPQVGNRRPPPLRAACARACARVVAPCYLSPVATTPNTRVPCPPPRTRIAGGANERPGQRAGAPAAGRRDEHGRAGVRDGAQGDGGGQAEPAHARRAL